MLLAQPGYLSLLPLAFVPLLLHVRGRTHLRRAPAWIVTGLRVLALAAVVLALVRPIQQRPAQRVTSIAVIDMSPSMPVAAQQAALQVAESRVRGPGPA